RLNVLLDTLYDGPGALPNPLGRRQFDIQLAVVFVCHRNARLTPRRRRPTNEHSTLISTSRTHSSRPPYRSSAVLHHRSLRLSDIPGIGDVREQQPSTTKRARPGTVTAPDPVLPQSNRSTK